VEECLRTLQQSTQGGNTTTTHVIVRDIKHLQGPTLHCTLKEWASLVYVVVVEVEFSNTRIVEQEKSKTLATNELVLREV
jgi:hypothetical protein